MLPWAGNISAPAEPNSAAMPLGEQIRFQSRSWTVVFTCALAGLLVVFFWARIVAMVRLWTSDGTYSLFALVPFVSVAIAYSKLKRATTISYQPSRVGFLIVVFVVATTVMLDRRGIGSASPTPLLLAVTLSGMVLALFGAALLRTLWVPLAFLLLLMPLPQPLLASIDLPLQEMCAKLTALAVSLVGFQVHRAGTMIVLGPSLWVNVAPPCNGVRSSLAMLFIALVYVYLLIASWQKKLALLAAALPLAYLGNFIRLIGDVSAVHTLGQGIWKYEQAWDYVTGFLIFLLPVTLLFCLAKIMNCKLRQEERGSDGATTPALLNWTDFSSPALHYLVLIGVVFSGILFQHILRPDRLSQPVSVFATSLLGRLPYQIGEYSGRELSTADCEAARAVYGGGLVCRAYSNYSNESSDALELFVAPAIVGVHSPDGCLRSKGWVITNHRAASSPTSPQLKFIEITAILPSSALRVCSYYWRSRMEVVANDGQIGQWLRQVAASFGGYTQNGVLVEICGRSATEREIAATSAEIAKFAGQADSAIVKLFANEGEEFGKKRGFHVGRDREQSEWTAADLRQ